MLRCALTKVFRLCQTALVCYCSEEGARHKTAATFPFVDVAKIHLGRLKIDIHRHTASAPPGVLLRLKNE